tara:strand:- start:5105 stop:5365 length:261 start_codon:yes stop_codon:yes gene_type:complete
MFVDYDGMTVDQMLEKQIELKRKVAQAHQSGMSPGLIAQMQNMLDILMVEYHSRVASDGEKAKRERAIEEGRDPDADNVMNIGDVE